jgi:NAD(P)-dependent dehydrogenase (short-subunit alcohol dehydrogenase family)
MFDRSYAVNVRGVHLCSRAAVTIMVRQGHGVILNRASIASLAEAYQPIGRMGTPEEVGYLALYLCSDEAAFVTGPAYPIDGGVLVA